DAGGAWGAEDPLERRTVAVQIFDVCAHRLDLKPVAAQLRGEVLESCAAGDECAAEAFAAEAPNDAGADAGSGPDQQEVTRVNRLGMCRLLVERRPADGSQPPLNHRDRAMTTHPPQTETRRRLDHLTLK